MYAATDELRGEELLDEVIAEYLNDEEEGTAPDRPELLARYPDLASELERFFVNQEKVAQFATPLRALSAVGVGHGKKKAVQRKPVPRSETSVAEFAVSLTVDPQTGSVATNQTGDQWWLADSDYEVLGELGRGGMGVVFKARQRSLKRLVALKVMRAGLDATPAERARFRQEAESVARLQHPNIVQIHEVGERDGFPFICFEFVDGGSLHARLTGAPLEHRAAAELVQTLARAVQFAHQHGIVHRDVKPANILLARSDPLQRVESGPAEAGHYEPKRYIPKLTDFGLAKRLDAELGHTVSGVIVGTPSYMAPEQASGQSKAVGPAADIYSLGATLYELVTGRPPFKAATMLDTVLQVLRAEPLAPQRLQPTCPRDLETIILKCLQKDPLRRYASAEALADDLHRFLSGEPIDARPAGVWERTIKWARRRPAVAALVSSISLAVLLLIGVVLGLNLHLQEEVNSAIKGEQQAQLEKRLAEQRAELAEKGQRLAALRAECGPLLEQAQAALEQKELEAAESLAFKAQVKCGEDPALADLKAQADNIAKQARHLLTARDNLRLLFQGRDDALFHLYRQMFTGLDVPDSVAAAKQAAQKALDLFKVASEAEGGPVVDESYDRREKDQIRLVCFELLLILAEATAREGKPAADADSLRRALAILERANRLYPSTQSYHLRRARYLGMRGDADSARKERVTADGLKPVNSLDAFVVGMDRWLVEGKPEEAVRYIEQAERGKSDLLWAPFFLGIAHLRAQDPSQAKAHLTLFINQRSDFVWAYLFRGSIHGELGEFEAAEADFERAGRLAQDDLARYVIHNNRGVMYIRQKKYGAAMADLHKAITLLPQQFHAYLSLAAAYREQQKWPLAVEQLDLAIQRRPKLALLYRDRAYVHLLRNDQDAALRDFEKAIEFEPVGSKTHKDHLECGLIFYRAGKHQETLRACAAALLLRPDYPGAHRLCGETLLALKKYRESLQAFDRYLACRGAPVAEVFQARALAHAALGDFSAAIEDYTQAIALKPDDGSLLAARGWAFLVTDAPKLALRDFETAIKCERNNGHAWNGRGYAQVKLGRHAEGAADAREAVRLGPKTSLTAYNAARVFAQASAVAERDGDQPSVGREQLAFNYRDEAIDRLIDALQLLRDDEERTQFWQQNARPDGALNPIRRSPRFLTLAARYEQPPQR